MSSTSSDRERRQLSKEDRRLLRKEDKDKGDVDGVSDRRLSRKEDRRLSMKEDKDKGEFDGVSFSLSEMSEYHKGRPWLYCDGYTVPIEDWTAEMAIRSGRSQQQNNLFSDSRQKKSEEENWYAVSKFADFPDCYKNPRHPDLVKKDPQGKLIPKISPENPFEILEVPPGIKCEVCDSSKHWSFSCPYLHNFPPDRCLKSPDIYQVVCHCGNPDVNPPVQGCRKCYPGRGFRVVPKYYYPSSIGINPSKHLLKLNSQPDNDLEGDPSYMSQRNPEVETYIPGRTQIQIPL